MKNFLRVIGVLFLVALIGYSFFWYKASSSLKDQVELYITENMKSQGISQVEYESASISGFPFRIGVALKNPKIEIDLKKLSSKISENSDAENAMLLDMISEGAKYSSQMKGDLVVSSSIFYTNYQLKLPGQVQDQDILSMFGKEYAFETDASSRTLTFYLNRKVSTSEISTKLKEIIDLKSFASLIDHIAYGSGKYEVQVVNGDLKAPSVSFDKMMVDLDFTPEEGNDFYNVTLKTAVKQQLVSPGLCDFSNRISQDFFTKVTGQEDASIAITSSCKGVPTDASFEANYNGLLDVATVVEKGWLGAVKSVALNNYHASSDVGMADLNISLNVNPEQKEGQEIKNLRAHVDFKGHVTEKGIDFFVEELLNTINQELKAIEQGKPTSPGVSELAGLDESVLRLVQEIVKNKPDEIRKVIPKLNEFKEMTLAFDVDLLNIEQLEGAKFVLSELRATSPDYEVKLAGSSEGSQMTGVKAQFDMNLNGYKALAADVGQYHQDVHNFVQLLVKDPHFKALPANMSAFYEKVFVDLSGAQADDNIKDLALKISFDDMKGPQIGGKDIFSVGMKLAMDYMAFLGQDGKVGGEAPATQESAPMAVPAPIEETPVPALPAAPEAPAVAPTPVEPVVVPPAAPVEVPAPAPVSPEEPQIDVKTPVESKPVDAPKEGARTPEGVQSPQP